MKPFTTPSRLIPLFALALALAFFTGCQSAWDRDNLGGTYFGAQNAADPVELRPPYLPNNPTESPHATPPPMVTPPPLVAPPQSSTFTPSSPTAPSLPVRK